MPEFVTTKILTCDRDAAGNIVYLNFRIFSGDLEALVTTKPSASRSTKERDAALANEFLHLIAALNKQAENLGSVDWSPVDRK